MDSICRAVELVRVTVAIPFNTSDHVYALHGALHIVITDGSGTEVYRGLYDDWLTDTVCTHMGAGSFTETSGSAWTNPYDGVVDLYFSNRFKPDDVTTWDEGRWRVLLYTVASAYKGEFCTWMWAGSYEEMYQYAEDVHTRVGIPASGTVAGNVDLINTHVGTPTTGTIATHVEAVDSHIGTPSSSTVAARVEQLNTYLGAPLGGTTILSHIDDILDLTSASTLKDYLQGGNAFSGTYKILHVDASSTLHDYLSGANTDSALYELVNLMGVYPGSDLATEVGLLKTRLGTPTSGTIATHAESADAAAADILSLTSDSNLKGYLAGTNTSAGLYKVMRTLECDSWSWDPQPGMGGTVYRDLEWIAAQMGVPATGTIAQQTDKIQAIKDVTDVVNEALSNIHDAVLAAQKLGVRLQRMLNDGAMFGAGESTQLLFAQFLVPTTGEQVTGGTATFVVKRASGTDITGNATWDGDSLWTVPDMKTHFEDRAGIWRVEITHSSGLTQQGLFLYGANAYEYAKISAIFQMAQMAVNRITGVVTVYDPQNPTEAVAEFDLRNADGSLPLPAKAVLNRSKARPPTP